MLLLVLGMLCTWTFEEADDRAANPALFSCEDVQEYFTDELEEDSREVVSGGVSCASFIVEADPACFLRFCRTIDPSNTAPFFGWLMPLRI